MLPRRVHKKTFIRSLTGVWLLSGFCFFSACQDHSRLKEADKLNDVAYHYHYRSLDSAEIYAVRALQRAEGQGDATAEALNNLAFVSIARMEYDRARRQLDSIDTDNEVELLVGDVQQMRLCQRQSENKSFYDYRERALRRLRRIRQDKDRLSPRQQQRMVYAESEFYIVESAYFYYVGLLQAAADAMKHIDPNGPVARDTAQLLAYFYNVGSGGILQGASPEVIAQREFDYLMRCYLTARQYGYIFFEAQALQALSEHLQLPEKRDRLIEENLPAMKFLNIDQMPDTLLAGNLAQRALDIFSTLGDVYQTAGAYRTLAECYWEIEDYESAEICLNNALSRDTAINRAPDLVASIREQLSLVYSAVNDKSASDYNRNIYLDMQERTRQDMQLEARAEQLQQSSRMLNLMIVAVVIIFIAVVALLVVFDLMRRKSNSRYSAEKLTQPLRQWETEEKRRQTLEMERREEINERKQVEQLHLKVNRRRNLEQRTKLTIVTSITPLIDRMIHEAECLKNRQEDERVRKERMNYMAELTEQINNYNNVLTRWIRMRSGELNIRVESFPLNELFNTLKRGRMAFQLKGINLVVKPTEAIVKADKTLTLFMLNTLADNARKFTPQGGTVTVEATEEDKYVEIEVEDTGCGIPQEKLDHLFDYKSIIDSQSAPTHYAEMEESHGFGLMNCKGIIEKYKKTSQLFSVCRMEARSELGKGTCLSFRLPKGIVRVLCGAAMLLFSGMANAQSTELIQARSLADSAYFANVRGEYERTLMFADSCLHLLDKGRDADDRVRLDIHNEAAVAALALHKWQLYHEHNRIYTQLFRQLSADHSLPEYCRLMQKSESNKTVAVIILMVLLLLVFPAYYILYYRHRLYFRYSVEKVNAINEVLLSDRPVADKLARIESIWNDDDKSKNERMAVLYKIVEQIKQALRNSMTDRNVRKEDMEMAADELRCIQYENSQLYVSNNVLDNCLSTLKHETMYYPSRIRQFMEAAEHDMETVTQLVTFYRELYGVLSRQALMQVKTPISVDTEMMLYLFELLQRQNNNVNPETRLVKEMGRYACVSFRMENLELTEEECRNLFTPLTINVDFLLCRQIIREMGEEFNARGCGIQAVKEEQTVVIEITMVNEIWKNLKLS